MKTTEENGVIFYRHHCKEGFIDRWMGDASQDPNQPLKKVDFQLNSYRVMFRLNGKGEWESRGNWKHGFTNYLLDNCETKTAEEIWNEFKINLKL